MTGQRLREIREAKGLKQNFVADRAGLTKQQLSRIETGVRDITLNEFVAIARAMGEEPGDLLPSTGGVAMDLRPLVELLSELSTSSRRRAAIILEQLAELDAERPAPPHLSGRVTPTRPEAVSVLEEIAVHDRK